MKFTDVQNSFIKGMLSPKMRGRFDLPEYKQGAAEIENAIGFIQGGLYRRPATEFMGNFTALNRDIKLVIPLSDPEFFLVCGSSSAAAGAGLSRLINYNPTTKAFTAYSPQLTPSAGNKFIVGYDHKFLSGSVVYIRLFSEDVTDFITIGQTTFITRNNGYPIVIYPATFTSSGGVKSSFWHMQLLNFPIDLDGLTLYRFNTSTIWKKYVSAVPYLNVNVETAKTLTASATTGDITITANFRIDDSDTADLWIGRCVKYTVGASTGVAVITGLNTATNATTSFAARVYVDLPATTATNNWQFSVVPKFDAIAFYQQRLFLGQDQSIYGSQIGNLQNFMVDKLVQDLTEDVSFLGYFGPLAPTDPLAVNISTREKEKITWLNVGDSLEVGTDKSEYTFRASDGGVLSSTNLSLNKQTSFGSIRQRTITSNRSTVMISSNQNFLRRFAKDKQANTDFYDTYVLNLYSDNIIPNVKFKKCVIQNESSVIWILTENNELLSCTYHEEANVVCWAKHSIAGADEIVTIVQDLFPNDPSIYLVIKRKFEVDHPSLPPVEATTLERIGLEYRSDTLNASDEVPCFMDLFRKYTSGSNTTTWNVFSTEFAYSTVDVLVDGILNENVIVDGDGNFTTTTSGKTAIVGYPFTTTVKTMPIESGSPTGTSTGLKKRINEVHFMFYNSKGCVVTDANGNNEYPLNFGDLTTASLTTGNITKKISINPDFENQFIIKQEKSLPMNLLGYVAIGQTYD